MEINKKELQNALEIVKPGLANKELVEQSTSFAFMDGKVITYNDELSISHPIPGLKLTGAILADNLYKFLNKIKGDDMDLTVEGNQIVLSTGRAKAGLTLQKEIKLPLQQEIEGERHWKKLPNNFLRDIAFVMTAAGKNMNRPILTCVHVNQSGFVEASDSFRIARRTLEKEMPIETFLIPASSVVELVKLNPTGVSKGKGWIHFRAKETGTEISCRVFKDTYKDMTPFLKVKGTQIILPNGLEGMLERAMVFAKRERILEEVVSISIKNKLLKMSASSESGWFKEDIDMEKKIDPISFDITPYLLKGILSETKACEVTKNRIKFEGDGWVYIGILRENKEKE